MRIVYLVKGVKVNPDSEVEINGITYSSTWAALSSPSAFPHIQQVERDDYPDHEKFNWTENADGTLNVWERDPVEVARIMQEKINQDAQQFLASTDWLITRAQEEALTGKLSSLSTEELHKLSAERDAARARIVKY